MYSLFGFVQGAGLDGVIDRENGVAGVNLGVVDDGQSWRPTAVRRCRRRGPCSTYRRNRDGPPPHRSLATTVKYYMGRVFDIAAKAVGRHDGHRRQRPGSHPPHHFPDRLHRRAPRPAQNQQRVHDHAIKLGRESRRKNVSNAPT